MRYLLSVILILKGGKNMINLYWFACGMSGNDWVSRDQLESKKKFLHDVFGAYRFEER
jgi:hypothetical protein